MNEDFVDLEQTITDSVNDAVAGVEDDPIEDTSVDATVEAQPETVEPEAVEATSESTQEVPSPATKEVPEDMQDEFEKTVGMSRLGVTGKENRIPYSRVKKITEKAVSEIAEAALGRKLNPGEKAADLVKQHVAQIPQLRETVQNYEQRLNTVGEFEGVMANDPQRFLQMLSRLPAYQQFFQFVENAYNALQAGYYQQPGQVQPQAQQVTATETMPEPDEALADGSKVYSMEGLKKLLAWNAQQVESKVSKQFEDRYKVLETQYQPIRKEWEDQKRIQSVLPGIRAQISEARTWPLFNENEEEITKALQQDRNISLEAAYRKVVFPKLVAERNTIRQNVLQEIKKAPTATSVSGRVTKPTVPVEGGNRKLEDIIKESIDTLR